jgi:methionine biosynthesis protein MetW
MAASPSAYYEDYWASGFRPFGRTLPRQLEALYASHIPPGSALLEVGCGDGNKNGTWARDSGRSYIGVDISRSAIAAAREQGLDARLIDDASVLPFGDASFRAVVCTEVLEHLFGPQLAVREMRRVLEPGGVVVATVPNIAHWRTRADLALLGRWHPGGDEHAVAQPWRDPHVRFFSPKTFAAMFEHEGFEILVRGGYNAHSTFDRVPGLRRFLVDRPAGRVTRLLTHRFPALFGVGAVVVGRKSG